MAMIDKTKGPQAYKKPWYEYKSDAEKALQTIRHIFGDNTFHEHQRIVGFLEGYVRGMEFVDRYED